MAWFKYSGKLARVPKDWVAPADSAEAHVRLESIYAWERRLRGYALFNEPVALEPYFEPYSSQMPARHWEAVPQPAHVPVKQGFISLLLPQEQAVSPSQAQFLLSALRGLQFPVALEIVAGAQGVLYQVACAAQEAAAVAATIQGQFPSGRFETGPDAILAAVAPLTRGSSGFLVVDFGLHEAAYRPLTWPGNYLPDPLAAAVHALGSLEADEMGGVQLLLTPASDSWQYALVEQTGEFDGLPAAHRNTGLNGPERALGHKMGSPWWAVALRVFAVTQHGRPDGFGSRALRICQAVGESLNFVEELNEAGVAGNALFAMDDAGYAAVDHLKDVLERRSRRPGMLLSQAEVAALWHPPSPSLHHPRLLRFDPRRREFPEYLKDVPGAGIGVLDPAWSRADGWASGARAAPQAVVWPDSFRNRHAYLLGATRMGKSTMMLNLAAQDLAAGRGLCLIDPHGDLALDLLHRIPAERQEDVLFLDLSDTGHPPALGLLEAANEWEQRLLVSDLLSILRRLFQGSWGDRLEHILRHVLLTLLAGHGRGHTLRDIRPLLAEEAYREHVLRDVPDPDLQNFWRSEAKGYNATTFGPVYNKLGLLLSSPVVRNAVCGGQGKLHPADIIAGRKALIVNLAQNLVGEDNAHFLGALLVSKIQLAAMHNLRRGREERIPFSLYADEFQNFTVSSFETILSEAGKAGLTLVMANQFLEQLPDRLQTAILANVGTLVSFRVSAASGRRLESEFGGHYGAGDLTDLERGQAVVRLGRAGDSYMVRTHAPVSPDSLPSRAANVEAIVRRTRTEVCRPRGEVEAELRASEEHLREIIAERECGEQGRRPAAKPGSQATGQTATGGKPVPSRADSVDEDAGLDVPASGFEAAAGTMEMAGNLDATGPEEIPAPAGILPPAPGTGKEDTPAAPPGTARPLLPRVFALPDEVSGEEAGDAPVSSGPPIPGPDPNLGGANAPAPEEGPGTDETH